MPETTGQIPKKDVTRLIREMVHKPDFAKEVIADPTKFQEQYSLSPKVVDVLSHLNLADFEGPLEEEALAMAAGGTEAQLEPVDGGGCYYGG